jgi:hypothetical protein
LYCSVSLPLLLILSVALFSLPQVSARDQIQHLTAQAWLSENKQLEQKVGKFPVLPVSPLSVLT